MNYDEMPAGREMDALVAERVLGIPKYLISINGPIKVPGKDYAAREVDYYSTDIGAAWDVVELMRTKLFSERLRFRNLLHAEIGARLQDSAIASGEPELIIHTSEDLLFVDPADICRAALKAIAKK